MYTKKMARLTIGTGLGMAMAAAALTVPQAQAAQASVPDAPPCFGHTCIGKSPTWVHNGLACVEDAKDVKNATVGLSGHPSSTTVTLRYSANCAANWARYNGDESQIHYWVQTKDGNRASGEAGQSPNYTTMVDGTMLARVCIRSTADNTQSCSGWF